jgi:hypothetical protein
MGRLMNRNKTRSKLQEKRIAKDVGGKVQKASGATAFAKGDVRTEGLLIEAKTTGQRSYRVDISEITKIQSEALAKGASDWAMQIEFQGQLGQNRKIAIIDWFTYLQFRDDQKALDKVAHKIENLEADLRYAEGKDWEKK